ncbi:MAG: helix-turn-helix transcriptional regulator [Thermoanaerobacteraceae bacterium]|jgi:DNA-binding Xre family transcriptional regulator|nr:helix-turn-helix transcriptional regulator [Thermoanaerobacteraceae bacterium]
MAVSYKKLFHLMIEKDITAPQLQKQAGFSGNILTRLRRNSYVSLESIETICKVLDCKVDDILEFVPDKTSENKIC